MSGWFQASAGPRALRRVVRADAVRGCEEHVPLEVVVLKRSVGRAKEGIDSEWGINYLEQKRR